MRILVYGAGALGSLLAAHLHASGQQVSLLARRTRLANLREDGLIVEDLTNHQRRTYAVPIVDQFASTDDYDWVIVVMGKVGVLEILPNLAANTRVTNFLFLGNNVSGGGEITEALGRERVTLGFLMAVGKIEGKIALAFNEIGNKPRVSVIGELDGSISPRLIELAAMMENAGFPTEISKHIEAWLKSHAALILPLAGAYFLAGSDLVNLAETPDVHVMLVRGIREALRVLRAYRIPIDPPLFNLFLYLPEPFLVGLANRLLHNPNLKFALLHAGGLRPEFRQLGREFAALSCSAGILTPHLDHLVLAARPGSNCLGRGSRKLEMDWSGVWLGGLALLTLGIFWVKSSRRRTIHARK
jgi:2-dehydropantoate 2-reductase